jgi:hypothetical protein
MRIDLAAMVQGDPEVIAVLGDNPLRFYPFGEADEEPLDADAAPRPVYATWQTINGRPENYLSERPDMDWYRVQIDVWAPRGSIADAAADALRNALEPHGYMVSLNLDGRDPETRLYRISFDFEFWVSR